MTGSAVHLFRNTTQGERGSSKSYCWIVLFLLYSQKMTKIVLGGLQTVPRNAVVGVDTRSKRNYTPCEISINQLNRLYFES